jgi:hypothetical protein
MGWSAERAASALKDGSGAMTDVAVICPGDPAVEFKLEPDDDGICRTLIRSHLLFGVSGSAAGVATALALVLAPWPAAAASPGFTMFFAAVMGTFFGMLVAGLITLRPDHGIVVGQLRSALHRGRWAVVAHPMSEAHARAALAAFRAEDGIVLRSLQVQAARRSGFDPLPGSRRNRPAHSRNIVKTTAASAACPTT